MEFTPERVVRSGLELASELKKFQKDLRDEKFLRFRDEICGALRSIYFSPPGVVKVVDRLIAGEELDEDDLQPLRDFNDAEWNVGYALEQISYTKLASDFRVSLATARQLDMIRYGKVGIRKAVKESINGYGQDDFAVNIESLKKLKVDIEILNEQIEELEGALNVRAMEN